MALIYPVENIVTYKKSAFVSNGSGSKELIQMAIGYPNLYYKTGYEKSGDPTISWDFQAGINASTSSKGNLYSLTGYILDNQVISQDFSASACETPVTNEDSNDPIITTSEQPAIKADFINLNDTEYYSGWLDKIKSDGYITFSAYSYIYNNSEDYKATVEETKVQVKYAISLDYNGGSVEGSSESGETLNCYYGLTDNNTLTKLPTKSGYTFKGYYNDDIQAFDEDGKFVAGSYWSDEGQYRYTGNCLVKAKWEAKPVTCKIWIKDGTWHKISEVTNK